MTKMQKGTEKKRSASRTSESLACASSENLPLIISRLVEKAKSLSAPNYLALGCLWERETGCPLTREVMDNVLMPVIMDELAGRNPAACPSCGSPLNDDGDCPKRRDKWCTESLDRSLTFITAEIARHAPHDRHQAMCIVTDNLPPCMMPALIAKLILESVESMPYGAALNVASPSLEESPFAWFSRVANYEPLRELVRV